MIVPSLDVLANARVNQWVAHLPEDHPLAQQHRTPLSTTAPITWTSSDAPAIMGQQYERSAQPWKCRRSEAVLWFGQFPHSSVRDGKQS
jgi:hypothetical protein